MTIGAAKTSFRPGEIRLADLGVDREHMPRVLVRVLDQRGVDRVIECTFAEKWGATGWQRVLQCHRCGGPARVLRVMAEAALCRKCHPQRTEHHRRKNSRSWRTEGAVADSICRELLQHGELDSELLRRLATRLQTNATRRAEAILDVAMQRLDALDRSGLLRP